MAYKDCLIDEEIEDEFHKEIYIKEIDYFYILFQKLNKLIENENFIEVINNKNYSIDKRNVNEFNLKKGEEKLNE